jgi:serine/threonine protein kinase
MSDQSFDTSHYYALPVGTNLFEFRIEQVLGHGGFGITYLATDTNLDERVAIKEYMPSEIAVRTSDSTVRAKSKSDSETLEQGLNSFLEEARTIARFRHRNIVHVRRFFRLNGTAYIVLEYEYGQTLGQYLETHKMGNDQLRDLLASVLDGLDVVHKRATLHRDLKPSNIILRPDESPVLIDFGAARDFQSRNSRSVTAIATAGYSPPEQSIGGQQGPWTDLYALGAIAYRIVSGTTPPDSLRRLRKDPLVPASSLDVEYDPAILRTIDWMLKIEESERPISVDAVRDSLGGTAFATGQNTATNAASGLRQDQQSTSDGRARPLNDLSVEPPSPPRTHRLALPLASLTVLVGIAIYLYEHPSQTSTSAPASKIQEKAPAEKVRLIYYQNKISEAWYDKQKLNALLDQCRSDADCTNYVPLTVNNRLRYLEQEKR